MDHLFVIVVGLTLIGSLTIRVLKKEVMLRSLWSIRYLFKNLPGYGAFIVFLMFDGFDFQNMRGGRVKLQSILMPVSEFDHEEKGDALHGKLIQAH